MNATPLTVLLAGCGDVGNALATRLLADGHRVIGLRRQVAALAPGVLAWRADLASGDGLETLPAHLPARIDAVVYTAAADERSEAAYQAAYVDGVACLREALARGQQAAEPRWLFVSSTAVYAQRHGEWIDETSATEPQRFNGRILLQAERALLAGVRQASVLRCGGIYGPGRRRLIETVLAGRGCVADPPQYSNRIHRDDCAGVLRHLLTLPDAAPLYLGVDCEPAPAHEVQAWLARRLGAAPPPRLSAADAGRAGVGSKRCSNARLLASGYRFVYPDYRAGYASLL